jgi:hypothetical protein
MQDLANLRSKRDCLTFARNYGLLFKSPPEPGYHETVSVWLARAGELRGALTMYALMEALVNSAAEQRPTILDQLKASIRPFRARLGRDGHILDQYTLAEQATILIAELINAHMPRSGVAATALLEQEDKHGRWSIATGAPPTFFWHPQFNDLVELAHFMLALSVMERLPVRLCQGCPRVFVPDPPDRLYHNDRCGAAARQRLSRARKKTT